jgi:hypothetical protein
MSARLSRFLENQAKANGPNGPNGTHVDSGIRTSRSTEIEIDRQPEVGSSGNPGPSTAVPLGPLGPKSEDPSREAGKEPKVERPSWTDDRAWLADIRHARDDAAKLAVLADWVAAAGGETCGRNVMLPALCPPRERRLAELELRRMCRQAGLEILENQP